METIYTYSLFSTHTIISHLALIPHIMAYVFLNRYFIINKKTIKLNVILVSNLVMIMVMAGFYWLFTYENYFIYSQIKNNKTKSISGVINNLESVDNYDLAITVNKEKLIIRRAQFNCYRSTYYAVSEDKYVIGDYLAIEYVHLKDDICAVKIKRSRNSNEPTMNPSTR